MTTTNEATMTTEANANAILPKVLYLVCYDCGERKQAKYAFATGAYVIERHYGNGKAQRSASGWCARQWYLLTDKEAEQALEVNAQLRVGATIAVAVTKIALDVEAQVEALKAQAEQARMSGNVTMAKAIESGLKALEQAAEDMKRATLTAYAPAVTW